MNRRLSDIAKIGKDTILLLTGEAQSLILMVLYSIALGRMLGEELFGIFSLSFAISLILRTIAEAGYDLSIPGTVAKKLEITQSLVNQAFQIKIKIWLIFFIPTAVIGYSLTGSFECTVLLVWIIPLGVSSTYKSVLRGLNDIKGLTRIEILWNFILYITGFAVLIFSAELILIYLVFLIFEIFKAYHYSIYIKSKLNPNITGLMGSKSENQSGSGLLTALKEQYKYAGIGLMTVLQNRVVLLCIGWFGTPIYAGEYSSAMRFITVVKLLPQTLMNILVPDLSAKLHRGIKSGLRVILPVSFLLGMIISLIFYSLAEPIMEISFGFSRAAESLRLLSFMIPFTMVNLPLESYLIAGNFQKQAIFALFLSLISAVIISILLLPSMGAIGAATAALSGEIILTLLNLLFALMLKRKKIQIS